ncbi:MAG: bifunctional diaminohydroxyphosphoribosylaminopyrimidine deaminase/5-amino-6-(5-phosphoribosylamino)uracil reductase RibD [Desulfuromonadaceae bacterium]|nr:bifunctional diaminohydroxyphosphoribosylaminopyrimidine deaminase/5-amino-6-(5-phosphoribosylamino)uracil reductase RibD [Desulfuromonadaceae bacterium]
MTSDTKFMKRALTLARKGIGMTSPNPAVGCIIVNNGMVVGEGWHKKAGGPHAEVHALEMAGDAARDAEIFVTLEPCCHSGKTPPCSDALIKAGVRRVVAGMRDPNPHVNGGGLLALESAGITTSCGVLEEECRAINLPFIKYVTTAMPYVTYKSAMTLDGNIATITGESRWVSCEKSRKQVHLMRSHMDAVMVGVDTIIADNPQLTVRHVRGKDPLRVIVDTRLRTPKSVTILNGELSAKTIIATAESNTDVHRPYLEQGATIVVCDEYDGRVSMKDLLQKLGEMGVQSILLEGGSHLAGNMLQQGLIDELVFFVAPKIIGSNGFAPFTLQGITSMAHAIKLNFTDIRRIGSDIVVTARPEPLCSPA